MITEDEKRMAINLAMKIDVGEITVNEVIKAFDKYPLSASVIMEFWCTFNEMTQQVAEKVGWERCRRHLEKCYKGNAKCLIMKQNLRVILNGLKQIWYGVKGCIIGAFQDFIQD